MHFGGRLSCGTSLHRGAGVHYASADEACLDLDSSQPLSGTCDGGTMTATFPACTAVDLPHLSHCGGIEAAFAANNSAAVGSCARGIASTGLSPSKL